MSVASAVGLSLAMLVLVASPGPGVLATVARAIASGFRPALPLICGIVLGDILYLLFAFYGLSVVARALEDMFLVVKLCGGAYLLWLGIRLWRKEPEADVGDCNATGASGLGNFASGVVVTLSNPAAIAFYCGFLPTFLDLSAPRPADFAAVATIVTVVLLLVLGTYAILASRARELFKSRRAVRRLNRAGGSVMIAAAVVIATRF
jgi:threonine/homoserine/homoserine lactone efflux protein